VDPGLSGPVVVFGSRELGFDLVEMSELGPSRRSIARARGAECASEKVIDWAAGNWLSRTDNCAASSQWPRSSA